jgi:hypothetical protein
VFAADSGVSAGSPGGLRRNSNVFRWTILGSRGARGVLYCLRMSSDDRTWTGAGLDPLAREALGSGLPASEVWSLLMGVLEERARARTPASLREQWRQDRFVQPCAVDQRALMEVDGHLFAAAAEFEAIELAPVAPLGVCASVALASQNKIVSTVRGTEVVSDPTNVLALECARRLVDGGRATARARGDPSRRQQPSRPHRPSRRRRAPARGRYAWPRAIVAPVRKRYPNGRVLLRISACSASLPLDMSGRTGRS